MLRATAILVLSCMSGVVLGREFMGHKVIDAPFVVAGGKTVVLPITDAGPIPAEDRKAKVEAAGFIITRSKDDSKIALIVWTFGLTNKSIKSIQSISVSEVAPADVEIPFVNDGAPQLQDKYWIGNTTPLAATRESVPWLFADGPSTFVFRITINEPANDSREYFQPAWFSSEAKAHFREMIARINGG